MYNSLKYAIQKPYLCLVYIFLRTKELELSVPFWHPETIQIFQISMKISTKVHLYNYENEIFCQSTIIMHIDACE
jgi:hypothetical protein